MSKFYKVLKDNFLWEEGAILSDADAKDGYKPINGTSIWDKTEYNGNEYISCRIVENCPEYFVQVYPINLLTKTIYKAKEEAKAIMAKEYGS